MNTGYGIVIVSSLLFNTPNKLPSFFPTAYNIYFSFIFSDSIGFSLSFLSMMKKVA